MSKKLVRLDAKLAKLGLSEDVRILVGELTRLVDESSAARSWLEPQTRNAQNTVNWLILTTPKKETRLFLQTHAPDAQEPLDLLDMFHASIERTIKEAAIPGILAFYADKMDTMPVRVHQVISSHNSNHVAFKPALVVSALTAG